MHIKQPRVYAGVGDRVVDGTKLIKGSSIEHWKEYSYDANNNTMSDHRERLMQQKALLNFLTVLLSICWQCLVIPTTENF